MTDQTKQPWSTGKIVAVVEIASAVCLFVLPCLIGMLMPATPSG